MKPSYYRRRNAFLSSPSRVVAVIGVFAVGILLITRLVFPGFFFSLTTPLFAFGNVIANGTISAEDVRANADEVLMNENMQLQERVNDLTRLLGTSALERRGVVAGVIARPPLAPYDTLLIGAGTEHGVSPGMLVSGDGGVPLGTIETATGAHAQVSLFSTAGRSTEGWVGDERLPITVVGEGGGAFVAEVPRDAVIGTGDLVYLPGPGARSAGRVERVDADPSSSSAILRIAPLVNIFSLSLVLVEEPS
jgi:cell shape-determining protein MreC